MLSEQNEIKLKIIIKTVTFLMNFTFRNEETH